MMSWKPTATINTLKRRAELIQKIRQFFICKNLLEVETPLIASTTVTDPYIESISVHYPIDPDKNYYLQTSPEYAMKRLLASGSGDIFQISKAFRNGEVGAQHNPEFSMLEWYRLGFNHHDLMEEMEAFLKEILGINKVERISYRELFKRFLDIDPFLASIEDLKQRAQDLELNDLDETSIQDTDTWQQVLMSRIIEPNFSNDHPVFIYDFPASQAALAKIRSEDVDYAERFEVYYKGVELANGFHELTDTKEQEARFKSDLKKRVGLNKNPVGIDRRFLEALQSGLPACSGVAIGIDRLFMILEGTQNISNVLSFAWSNI